MEKNRFTQKIVLVTGGASGIGQACAERFANEGAKVIIADINLDGGKQVAAALGGTAIAMDVGDDASIAKAAEMAERDVGPIDILVNSAGIIQRPLPPDELSVDDYDRVVAIDQRGTYLVCRTVGTAMAERGHGAIINIASITGLRSTPLHAYAPAKAAVIAMSECLAGEWGRSGVRVNTVSPGYTLTPALQDAIDRGDRDVNQLTDTSALGQLVQPADVAAAVTFLASNEARVITGVNLPVDAGWLTAAPWATYGGVRAAR